MIFNSIPFCIFFVVVFYLYYFPLKENLKAQNWLLLLSSYFFYGYANWKMIPLLLVPTAIIFLLGKAIDKTDDDKKSYWLTTIGVLIGVGLLLYFKYFNFFLDSFSSALNVIGLKSNIGTLNIIMPLGISYFSFKLISYIVEIQRGKIKHCDDFISFSTYIAFFPTILSGPIDKPNTFIPQIQKKRSFDYALAVDGCKQILWGLFQKVVIADNLTTLINYVWGDISNQSGFTLLITAILYSIQLYTDFSGYSHMAIGIGKILGFRITINFNYPYFSRNIAEFWRKWHISLTSWITDYVFMPLNIKFRNLGKLGIILAIIINMIVVGMWHGANWTFLVFGLYNGLLFIPLILSGSIFKKKKLKTNNFGLPVINDFLKMIRTFLLFTFGLIIFRAENIEHAWHFIKNMLTGLISFSDYLQTIKLVYREVGIGISTFILLFFVAEWIGRHHEFALQNLGVQWKRPLRYAMYFLFIISILWLGGKQEPFIYFQF